MKMYPNDWRARLTTAGVIGVCLVAARMLGPAVGIHGFWLGMLVPIVVGIVLGNLVGRLLFRPSSGGPPDELPRD
jgi:hypothetical protein